ncbi:MAG TPA: IS256 family transposase, partial [Longimicrobiaceae bacterium]|nr:IS256 family transposase [Longimicrobiaceae bacterium]
MAKTSIDLSGELVQRLFQDPDRLREVLQVICQAAMAQEVAAHVGAGPHERTGDRRGRRNGSKSRTLLTRVGGLGLSVPQVRDCDRGPYHPSLFARWERSERALLVACGEMYFQGVSTRNVREVLETMCDGVELSAMTVSRVAQEIDEKLAAFRARRLDGQAYPYVKVDARYEKVRVDGRVISQAVLVVMGFTQHGRREILDWRLADSESEGSWSQLFRDLKDRGLGGVELLVSDAHAGIVAAATRHLQGVAWQRCQVHFKRELLRKVSYKRSRELMADVLAVFKGDDLAECLRRGEELAAKWETRAPPVARMMREGLGECLTVPSFPADHRMRL